jgi:hypothetical protein
MFGDAVEFPNGARGRITNVSDDGAVEVVHRDGKIVNLSIGSLEGEWEARKMGEGWIWFADTDPNVLLAQMPQHPETHIPIQEGKERLAYVYEMKTLPKPKLPPGFKLTKAEAVEYLKLEKGYSDEVAKRAVDLLFVKSDIKVGAVLKEEDAEKDKKIADGQQNYLNWAQVRDDRKDDVLEDGKKRVAKSFRKGSFFKNDTVYPSVIVKSGRLGMHWRQRKEKVEPADETKIESLTKRRADFLKEHGGVDNILKDKIKAQEFNEISNQLHNEIQKRNLNKSEAEFGRKGTGTTDRDFGSRPPEKKDKKSDLGVGVLGSTNATGQS